jgi:hypothetical protein
MKNLTTKKLLAASAATLISINTLAVVDAPNTTIVTFDHPQSISISNPDDASTAVSSDVSSTTWTINSNNAVKVIFTGTSFAEDGASIAIPILAKQESNASNKLITGQYDQLTTTFGVSINGQQSAENAETAWGGGTGTTGTPTNLVGGALAAATNSSTNHFGAIMTSDSGSFTLTLSTKGSGDVSATQSGDYTATVTTTVTAAEKDGSAGVAD